MRNIGRIEDAESLRAYVESLGLELPFDDEVRTGPDAPLGSPFEVLGRTSATASRSCPWRAGTARPTGARPISPGGAGSAGACPAPS